MDTETHHSFVLLGAAGDLAAKKTFPSLFKLYLGRYLPHNLAIVGCDGASFHPDVRSADDLWARRIGAQLQRDRGATERDLHEFRQLVSFVSVDLADAASVAALDSHVRARAAGCSKDHRVFYLALPSKVFGVAVEQLKVRSPSTSLDLPRSRLISLDLPRSPPQARCWSTSGACRVVVEKPFGRNGQEARSYPAAPASPPLRLRRLARSRPISPDLSPNLAQSRPISPDLARSRPISRATSPDLARPRPISPPQARQLSAQLARHLTEAETFRIDHYLAKTLVTNLLAFRFGTNPAWGCHLRPITAADHTCSAPRAANRELGRLFHADNVANVRITFKEAIGVAGRAGYFDECAPRPWRSPCARPRPHLACCAPFSLHPLTSPHPLPRYGIIRDIMQNHLMQVCRGA